MPLWGRKDSGAPQGCIRSAIIIHHRDVKGNVTGERSYGLGYSGGIICLLPGSVNRPCPPLSSWAKLWFYRRLGAEHTHPDKDRRHRDSSYWYDYSSLPATIEVFGQDLGVRGHGSSLLEDGTDVHFEWWPDGAFSVGNSPDGFAVGAPTTSLMGPDGPSALVASRECVDRRPPTGVAPTAAADGIVGSVLGELDEKQVGYVKALVATRLIRLSLESEAARTTATRDAAAEHLKSGKTSLSVQATQEEYDLSSQSLEMIAESLEVVERQEVRIERMVDRIRDYRSGLRARSQEARRAAEVASATSDVLAMATRVTGGTTSGDEIDSAEEYVSSVSRSLETRIEALKGLVPEQALAPLRRGAACALIVEAPPNPC